MGNFLFLSARLSLSVGTCLSFLPALYLIYERRRHFELFVGAFQLYAAVMYMASDVLGGERFFFLKRDDWHQISDILTETYVCLLFIHLMGLRSEDAMTSLRYLAFGGSWIAKLADGWGNVAFEVLLIASFVLPAVVLMLQALIIGPMGKLVPGGPGGNLRRLRIFLDRTLTYNLQMLPMALGCALAGAVLLIIELKADTQMRLFNALAHCAFGGTAYFIFKSLPCYDKTNALPQFR